MDKAAVEKIDLKPCPFCGSEDIRSILHKDKGGHFVDNPYWQTDCLDCYASTVKIFESEIGIVSPEYETIAETSQRMWNMRTRSEDISK